MIKVEKGMREIKAVNGVPDIMTDLACIIRSIRTTMVEKRDYSEAETKELVKQAVKDIFSWQSVPVTTKSSMCLQSRKKDCSR